MLCIPQHVSSQGLFEIWTLTLFTVNKRQSASILAYPDQPSMSLLSACACSYQVEELSEFSARRHADDPSRSRCFRRVMFCALHNGQSPRPARVLNASHPVEDDSA